MKINLHIPKEQKAMLDTIKKVDGIPISEQVRRAITKYIEDWKNDYKRKLAEAKKVS